MKLILTEEQIKKAIEEGNIPVKVRDAINAKSRELAKKMYGDEYNTPDERLNTKYNLRKKENGHDSRIIRNAQFSSGPFTLGNGKLSPDTLIINFTSAVECPSRDSCPVAQVVCYAVAGENRLDDTRKKNLAVQDLWRRAARNPEDLQGMFDIAEMYISTLAQKTKTGKDMYKRKVRFIRYNEAGDFPNMKFLQAAAAFSKKMRDEYGVLSMAYTARVGLDFSTPLEGTNEPIDHIIKINASRVDIKRSKDVVNQQFFAVQMGFKENIENNEKAEYVTFKDLDDLKYIAPTDNGTIHGIKSAPYLQYGKWTGGEGYYYICPCSFTIRDKLRINAKYFLMAGIMPGFEQIQNPDQETINQAAEMLNDNSSVHLIKKLPKDLRKLRDDEAKTVKSPCGTKCAVCHDMEGGILPDGTRTFEYNVLTATHGALASNYNPEYSNRKRMGDDTAIYSKDNPKGHFRKYSTNAPIRSELLKNPEAEINEQKKRFWEFLNKINNVIF